MRLRPAVATAGTIKKVESRTPWETRWWENGRQRKRRFRTKGMAEAALRAATDREVSRKSGVPQRLESITYGELAVQYQASVQVERKDWVEDMLAHSIRAFGVVPVREITPPAVSHWLNALPLGPSAARQALTKFRAVLDDAVDLGYLARNPAQSRLIRLPKLTPSDVRPFESWADVFSVAGAAGRYGPLIVFACATGLRPEEWAALRWMDVDFGATCARISQVTVEGRIKATGKTDGSLRTIVLQDLALAALAEMVRPIDRRATIFSAPMGGPVVLRNFRRRDWVRAVARAGFDKRPPYQMRHTYATLALSAGADIYWVSRQLGTGTSRRP